MTKVKGKDGKLYDGSNMIAEVKDWSIDVNMNLEDTTAMGDVAEEVTPTIYGADMSFSGFYDPDDTAQGGLLGKLIAGTPLTFDAIYSGTHGGTGKGITGTLYLSKYSRKGTHKGMVEFDASGKFSGTISEETTL